MLKKLTYSAFFTALIAVLAQIAVPLPFSPIPVTAQLAGVMLAGSVLGSRSGTLSVTAYILLGAAGLPVFSMARGGIYILTGPTGGYLWGFIPAAFIVGLLLEKPGKSSYIKFLMAMMVGLLIVYVFGGLQLGLIMRYGIIQVLVTGILPFLPFDLVKIALSAMVGLKVIDSLKKNGLWEKRA